MMMMTMMMMSSERIGTTPVVKDTWRLYMCGLYTCSLQLFFTWFFTHIEYLFLIILQC